MKYSLIITYVSRYEIWNMMQFTLIIRYMSQLDIWNIV